MGTIRAYLSTPRHSALFSVTLFFLISISAVLPPDDVFGRDLFEFPFKESDELVKRVPFEKPVVTRMREGQYKDRIIVKFAEGTEVRIRDEQLVSLRGRDMGEVRSLLARHNVLKFERRASDIAEETLNEERRKGQDKSGMELADLNLYYLLKIDATRTDPESLINDLNALDIVEIAYPDSASKQMMTPPPSDQGSLTYSFVGLQRHLLTANNGGIGAQWVWDSKPFYRSDAKKTKMIHIECGWTLGHEDLPIDASNLWSGVNADNFDHGTAIQGILIGYPNNYFNPYTADYGVTGIASREKVVTGLVSYAYGAFPPAILRAITCDAIYTNCANAGDIIHIESGPKEAVPGTACDPADNCSTYCNEGGSGAHGSVPQEHNPDSFEYIKQATAKGVLVFEAAGNGQMNLDDPYYQNKFNRNIRDSGAIMVGAGKSTYDPSPPYSHLPICFTSYGGRVDVQGWGENIMTTEVA